MLTNPTLVYDGNCGFCRRWVERLRRRDEAGRIALIPAAERSSVPGLPPLDAAALDRAMHLVLPDGTVLAGARALPAVLRLLPRWWLVAWVFRIPGVPWVADRVYAWVAARRHRFGCERCAGQGVKNP